MAQNEATIRLTGDNKSALAAITGVKNGLTGLNTTVETVNKKMQAFTNAIVGVGIVAFTKSLLDSSNQLKDMSNALEINTARLMEMSVAASASGGDFEMLTNMIGKLEQNIGDAINGNQQMQVSLAKVGIGINEINTLSPDEIFNKIAKSLAGIRDPAIRAALATDVLNKNAKFFNWKDYNSQIGTLRGTMTQLGASQETAAAISERLNMVMGLIKAQFLNLLSPILNLLAPSDDLGRAFTASKIAAEALLIALGALIAASIVNGFRAVAGAVASFATMLGLSTGATRAESAALVENNIRLAQNIKLRAAEAAAQKASLATQIVSLEERVSSLRAEGATTREVDLALGNLYKARGLDITATKNAAGATAALNVAQKSLNTTTLASVGIFASLRASIAGLLAGLAAIGTAVLAVFAVAGAPIWATVAAGVAALTGAVIVATYAWRVFGDVIQEFIGWIWDGIVAGFNAVNDAITRAAEATRKFFKIGKENQVQGNIGATQTPANAPSLLTQSVGEQNKGLTYGLSDQQKAAQAALAETIRGYQAEAQYLRDVVSLGEMDAKIKKAISDEQAKLQKTNQSLTQEQKNQIAASIQQTAYATSHKDIAEKIYSSDNETYLLSIKDVNEREIQAQKRALIHQYGKYINAEDLANLDTALRINQAKQDQIKIEEAMATLRGETKKSAENAIAGAEIAQTPAEKIQAQYNLQLEQLNQALDRKLISEEAYQAAVAKIQRQQYDAELQMYIDAYDAKDALRAKQIEAEARMYAEMLKLQTDFNGERKVSDAEALERGRRRAEFEKKTELEKTQWAIEQLSTISGAVGSHNKTIFRMSQAAAIGKAIMSTYAGAAKAYEDYGYPWGIAAAAAVIAGGMAQVAQIRSQTYSGKAVGGPMVGGKTYLVGERGPELFTPGNAGNMTPNDKLNSGTTNVTFQIVANDTRGFDELLNNRKGLITKIIADAQLEKGRRQ